MIVTSYNQVPKVAGIYRITSPTQKAYIGQATNLYRRLQVYFSFNESVLSTQPKIYHSIVKYNIDNHVVEILETCTLNCLDEKEQYYKELWISAGGWESALFFKLNDTGGGERSLEMREKMRNSQLGKKKSNTTKEKISKAHMGMKKPWTSERNTKMFKGRPGPNQKKIKQYNNEMQVIATYQSIQEAITLTKINPKACLAGICHTAGGFIWKYDNSID